MAYAGPDLPVPPVYETGEAFGGHYAVSERRYGRFLETVDPAEAAAAGPALVRLLGGLKAVPPPSGEDAPGAWRASVRNAFVDDPRRTVSGWRATIAADPALDRLFRACEDRVASLGDALPERRDLVHGDLLHANVLVSDAAEVTAVFSWKCAERGDFLYDVAWCTFWSHFHPGIAAADVWPRVLRADWARAEPGALADAAVRHHCYELAIGASHLGWYVYTGDAALLREVAARTAEVLERGPLRDGA
jgi:aminoglycoside phosphotransferase (APT) family kinase protein